MKERVGEEGKVVGEIREKKEGEGEGKGGEGRRGKRGK